MINPVKGRLTTRFGNRIHPITKKPQFHNGIDIAAPEGTDIVAPTDVKFQKQWLDKAGGISLSVITGDGMRFGFAHLSKVIIKPGESAKAGDVIAKVGNTGRSTGAHLHFTVKINGVLKDPLDYFKY